MIFRPVFLNSARFLSQQPPHICIVGGGGIGSACAHFLTSRGAKVTVVEKDPSYKFSTPENIQMSVFGAHFLRKICENLSTDSDKCNVNFFEGGYLYLIPPGPGVNVLKEVHEVQMQNGADNVLLSPSELKSRFPWLNVDGIEIGSLGVSMEGWFDPYALLWAFRKKAISNGASYKVGKAVEISSNSVKIENNEGQLETIPCSHIINAAGAFSRQVCEMARVTPVPVYPRRRQVFVFRSPADLTNCPLLIDPSGVYMRRETTKNTYLAGFAPENDPNCSSPDDLTVDSNLFDNEIWPVLAERIPQLEDLRVVSSWAGFYEYNTFDQNGIVGPHTEMSNFYLATGFSGHGIQQAAAVGRALSELIIDGKYSSIDLTSFGYDRFEKNKPIIERNII